MRRVRRTLLGWYRRHRRDLPWRRSRDPYAIWVAEIMLQQTRVDVVTPYFERFMARYPTVSDLARAAPVAVLQAWSGLGYYSRARHLHAAAAIVVREHGGRIPADLDILRELPGIGRYTAGAIASIAFDAPAPILDGNVIRVFARLRGATTDVGSRQEQARLWQLAERWACGPAPGDANQALMELGATVCTPKTPNCPACPVRRACAGHRRGIAATLPRRQPGARGSVVRLGAALVRDGSRLLLVRRRSGKLLRDWWEVPTQTQSGRDGSAALRRALTGRLGVAPQALRARPPRVRHAILSHRLEVSIYAGSGTPAVQKPPRARPAPSPRPRSSASPRLANLDLETLAWRWVAPSACARLPLSTLTRKILAAASTFDSTWNEYVRQTVGEHGPHERRRHPAQEDV